jgi:hypothetical protein
VSTRSLANGLLADRLTVDRLEDLVCCCAALLGEPAPVLCRGVRGKINMREEGRGNPFSDDCERAGDAERKERLKPRKEEGVWRIFVVRGDRAGVGVEGTFHVLSVMSPSLYFDIPVTHELHVAGYHHLRRGHNCLKSTCHPRRPSRLKQYRDIERKEHCAVGGEGVDRSVFLGCAVGSAAPVSICRAYLSVSAVVGVGEVGH